MASRASDRGLRHHALALRGHERLATDGRRAWRKNPRHRDYGRAAEAERTLQPTASDGKIRRIGAGEIVLVEETTGTGHITKSSRGKPRHTIFVPID